MRLNGLLIDCARLIERHDYYFEIIDFMAHWGMNTLILHFTDDHGCSIVLPGYEHLAAPHAFTADEIRSLTTHAEKHGIDLVPELETFGHTRYLTDRAEYSHLYAGRKTRKLTFNALDPLNPDTLELARGLIASTAALFPSRYLHIGCDEVDLEDYCRQKGRLDKAVVWSDYVNRIIGIVHEQGKTPMMWADHIVNDSRVEGLLRKDVAVLHWNYEEAPNAAALRRLRDAGFARVIACPSIACYKHRFLPTRSALVNTAQVAKGALEYGADGFINTVWCPYRYLQRSMYYGIAFGAALAGQGNQFDVEQFHRRFARQVFGTEMTPALARFLSLWPELHIDNEISMQIIKRRPEMSPGQHARLERMNRIGREVLDLAAQYEPRRNDAIWRAMVLAAMCAWLCTERWVLANRAQVSRDRADAYADALKRTRTEMLEDWDRTRYPDDPQKMSPKFPDEKSEFAIQLIASLPSRIRGKTAR